LKQIFIHAAEETLILPAIDDWKPGLVVMRHARVNIC